MSRLPVEPDADGVAGDTASHPTIRLSWFQCGLGVAVMAISFVGDVLLPLWLGIDLDCLDGEYRRRAALVETAICSAKAGPTGWLFIAWLAAPIALFSWWLRQSLRRAKGCAGK